jgi:hypothetical protein
VRRFDIEGRQRSHGPFDQRRDHCLVHRLDDDFFRPLRDGCARLAASEHPEAPDDEPHARHADEEAKRDQRGAAERGRGGGGGGGGPAGGGATATVA